MSYCELGLVSGGSGATLTLSQAVSNGNVLSAGQTIDGSASGCQANFSEINVVAIGALDQPANDIFLSGNLNCAPTIPLNYQGEIQIQRQLVDYLTSDATSLKMPQLPSNVVSDVVGFDPITKKLSYMPPTGGGGETLAQTLTLGNDTQGQAINAQTGELLLQKAGTTVLETANFTAPPPFGAGPVPAILTDRPIGNVRSDAGTVSMAIANNNAFISMACPSAQPNTAIVVSNVKTTILASDLATAQSTVTLDYPNKQASFSSSASAVTNTLMLDANVVQSKLETNDGTKSSNLTLNNDNLLLSANSGILLGMNEATGAVALNGLSCKSLQVDVVNGPNSSQFQVNSSVPAIAYSVNNGSAADYHFTVPEVKFNGIKNFDISNDFGGGQVFISSLTNATQANALYYDTLTKEVTYDTAGGGAVPPLNQVLSVGTDTGGAAINANVGDIILQKAGVNVFTSAGTTLTMPTLSLNGAPSELISYNSTTKQLSYAVYPSVATPDLNTVMGVGNSTTLPLNFDPATEIDIQRSGVSYLGSDSTSLLMPNLPSNVVSDVVGFDSVTKKLSYMPAGGGSQNLNQVLTVGNDTLGLPILTTSGNMVIRESGVDILRGNGAGLNTTVRSQDPSVTNQVNLVLTANIANPPTAELNCVDSVNPDVIFHLERSDTYINGSINFSVNNTTNFNVKNIPDYSPASPDNDYTLYWNANLAGTVGKKKTKVGSNVLNGITGVVIACNFVDSILSNILVSYNQGASGVALANLGSLVVADIVDGVSFTVYSTNVLDTSTFNYRVENDN